MKVTGQTSSQISTAGVIKKTPTAGAGVTGADERFAPLTEHVKLSGQAKFLSILSRHIAALPVVDEARVQEVKTRINSAGYVGDYLLVAERLILDEQSIH